MKKLFSVLALAVLTCCFLTGCSIQSSKSNLTESTNEYYFYYVDGEETQLERLSYNPEEETSEFMIPDLITRMNGEEKHAGGAALLPPEVRITSYDIADGVIQVVFNDAYSQMSPAREILVRAGVVKTFLQVPGIQAVKFRIGMQELLDTKGQPIGEMTRDSFAEMEGSDRDAYCYGTFVLYFTDESGEKLVPENRNVYYKRNLPKERVALEQLIKGPMMEGNCPVLAGDTEVLRIFTSNQICYVDVSREFLSGRSGVAEQTAVAALVNTVISTTDAQKVRLLVDGDERAVFGSETELYQFFKWNEDLIQEEGA